MIPQRARAWAQEQCAQRVLAIEPVIGGRTETNFVVRLADSSTRILRYADPEVWGATGRRHVRAEALGCQLIMDSPLTAPQLIASDPEGIAAGGPANLTTFLSGEVRLDPIDRTAIDDLARALLIIHRAPLEDDHGLDAYRFVGPVDLEVPTWGHDQQLWQRAIEIYADDPPTTPMCLLHHDFHPGNVLWEGDKIAGVIDWAETAHGPADLDVAHAATNFALLHDHHDAVAFTESYLRHGGRLDPDREARRYWQVADVLGFLPDPGPIVAALLRRRPDLTVDVVRHRLKTWLAQVLIS